MTLYFFKKKIYINFLTKGPAHATHTSNIYKVITLKGTLGLIGT